MNINLMNLFLKNHRRNPFLKPLIIAHRGASGYEPENTLKAFKRAIELGSLAIELDVFLCKPENGQEPPIVVIHDETIDRTTNGHGLVNEITWKELQKYDAGNGQHIPLFTQVLDLLNNEKIKKDLIINIELKTPDTAKSVAFIIKYYINQYDWKFDNFIVSSSDISAIQEFQDYLPEIRTGIIFYQPKKDVIRLTQKAQAQYIILNYESITANLIARAHSHGLFVFVYTVNDTAIAEELATWHIDGIITDYPDILNNTSTDPNILH